METEKAWLAFRDRLLAFIRRRVRSEHDAEDALVEVIVWLVERGAEPVDAIGADVAGGGRFETGYKDLDGFEDRLRQFVGDVGLTAA